ncbi:tyrosine-protein phosphatase non-receptor type 13-like isoform X3 [Stylophora pistillata]|uniref:tyrosine-protein phosphatase non-receptor type 13-like isoform X3 n=1 Tax=Stylophora pistillata TaxID=50429 RepID=UPI000C0417D6|nr:tyrosine-protein phosphatase non-receptor type 13-like isoform X3 [Stylophora pistillata]
MPALTANSVTLDEILVVRAGPLREEELWALLSQSSVALQDVFIKGKARRKGLLTYTITPESLLLCHDGKVKFSLHIVSSNNRSYTAPEMYSKQGKPMGSEGTLEKMCIYSLGMTLYHAAEYEIPVGKPVNLSETLENVLLSMCEESSQLRISLVKVIEVCHAHRKRHHFNDLVASMVAAVLGDEVPDNDEEDYSSEEETVHINHTEFLNGESSSLIGDEVSPRSLPSPPPSRISTRGQATSEELVGSNFRRSGSPTELALVPRKRETRIPHVLDKYKDHLERVRRERHQQSSVNSLTNGFTSMEQSQPSSYDQSEVISPDQSWSRSQDQSRPSNSATLQNGTSWKHLPSSSSKTLDQQATTYEGEYPKDGYFEGPIKGLDSEVYLQSKPDLVPAARSSMLRRYDSDTSITDTSSMVSGPRSSVMSGRSSMMSITQGSYAPESYMTDGYESEPYLTSIGSSASRAVFRDGRDSRTMSRPYSSTMDLRKQVITQQSLPTGTDEVDHSRKVPQRFLSVPDIHVSGNAPKDKKGAKGSRTKLGDFFGPEFVLVEKDPNLSVVNISPRKAGSVPHGRRLVTVIMLNRQKLQMMIEVTSTTQDLFDQVIKYLGLTEKFFFGLTQQQGGEHIFLDLDVKLAKYAPAKWKEEGKQPTEKFLLHFRVKFYVENVALISNPQTTHQFYLQLREDILRGQLYCHEEASFNLGGLALQAETGDYNGALRDEYFLAEHYVPNKMIEKISLDHATQELPRFHKSCHGLSEEEAELEFIKEAQKLQEYGIHFYKVQRQIPNTGGGKSKKSNRESVWLGICVRGVTVYEARGHMKFPVNRHSWPFTKKLSFKKKKFFIEPRENPDTLKMTFYTDHYKKSRYLLQMSQAFHRFQMKMKTKMSILDQEMSQSAVDESQARVDNGSTDVYHRPPYMMARESSKEQSEPRAENTHERQRSLETNRLPDDNLRQTSRDPQNERRRYSTSDESEDSTMYQTQQKHTLPEGLSISSSQRQFSQDVDDERDVDMPYVIDSTLNSQKLNKVISRDLSVEAQEERSSEVVASPDREICTIKFEKEPGKLLGITVLGGENSKRLNRGIYVKSVTEGGAAWKDGRLKAGDRILAVNGQSLERVTHEHAVSVLKNVTSPVELKVSQSSFPLSSLDLSSIPNISAINEEPQSLEIKPLTPRDTSSAEPDHKESLSSRKQSPEPHRSTFTFPSEDEPVTMISKSIPPSVMSVPSASSRQRTTRQDFVDSHKVSQAKFSSNSTDTGEPSIQRITRSTPLEANVIHSSLLSATMPLVSASVASPQGDSPNGRQESLSGDESGVYSEDALPERAFVVELEKRDGGLGLSVSGGINTSVKLGGIYIKSLLPNGPADMDGRVQIGDRILQVNGISLVGVTHKQAVETIKMAPQRTRLVLDRSVAVNIPKSSGKKTRSQPSDKPFMVELVKGVGGLGLSLVGGKGAGEEHGGFLRIKKMFPGQPAASCGKLQIGDIFLEVNGNNMHGVTHQEAINHIRMGPQEVKLLVKRDPSSIPQSLLQRTGSNASDVDPAQILADIQNKLRSNHSPSLSTRSSDSSTREQHSPRDEIVKVQEVSNTEAPVSLRSSLMATEPVKYPDHSELNRPGLINRSSEPAIQVKTVHNTLAATNSLPNVISVRPTESPKISRQEAFHYGEEDDDGDVSSLGDAPLAEDESSDVEDSRRTSSIDIIPANCSIYDVANVQELMGKLSTVESQEERLVEPSVAESVKTSVVSDGPPLQEEAVPFSSSSESEGSDVEGEEEPVNKDDDKATNSTPKIEDEKKSASMTPKEEVLHIDLVKGSGGLGFTLSGGADTVGGCFVRDIVGGPAKEDGRLHQGDQILRVDGHDISSMKHMDAVNILRATKQHVKLVVLRRPTGCVGSTKTGPMEVVNLTRTTQGRIGLLIKEGEDQKIYVEDVVPGEPAATQGSLRQGDRILEINGSKVDGVGFVAARQHLDAARPVARLLVERRPHEVESKYAMNPQTSHEVLSQTQSLDIPDDNRTGSSEDAYDSREENGDGKEIDDDEEEGEQFTMKLDKGPRGFGFSLVAAPTFNSNAQGIFIKTISPDSVAENDGRLKVGDQILQVNGEDVQGLSHARVIGMLRKITGTVELEISRPSKLYGADASVSSRKGSLVSPETTRAPLERAPHSVDLDITLEDKDKTLSGSRDIQDEDDVTELLNAISVANVESSPPTSQVQHKQPSLQKRDTDSVLSTLLASLEPPPSPPESLPSVDPRDFDSQWESGYSDNEETPDLVSKKSRQFFKSGSSSPAGYTNIANDVTNIPKPSDNDTHEVNHTDVNNELAHDSSIGDESSSDVDDDIDINDEDVFDMLRDNSQLVINMLNENDTTLAEGVVDSNNTDNRGIPRNGNILDVLERPSDVPPPIPTTPLPSDDDEPPVKPPPRVESLPKFSGSDSSSKPVVNGTISGHVSREEPPSATEPLIDVAEDGCYTGHQLDDLIRTVREKLDSNVPAEEFKALREIKQTDGCDKGKRPANRDKNRYRNVLPFDKTRVKLSGDGDNDYINASHVKIPVGDDIYHYIASQGPLPNTTEDFWQMIWEQEVIVIAMVTLEIEGGKVKCHRYWPESEDQPLVFKESMSVSLQRKEDFDSFVEREFQINNLQTGETRTVSHINFTSWPDHGVPKTAVELVEFVRFMRLLADGPGPIVVHCSAGIGRTGALITIDVAMGLMERESLFDVNKIIRNLREQRQGMIQTKDQYIFCYKACLDVLQSLKST